MIPKSMRLFLTAACYSALGLATVVALVVGVRTYQPRQPLAWYLLAAGQLSFTGGDTILSIYQWVLQKEAPFPSSADAVYLACYAFLGGGLLLLARAQTPGRDRTSLIDAVIIATGAGLLSWIFLIVPYVRDPELNGIQRVVSVAYPVADVLLLAVAVRLWRPGSTRNVASMLLTTALAAVLVSDAGYGLSQLTVAWVSGGVLDLAWVIYLLGLGSAALHPSMRALSEQAPPPPRD